ncbi:phosphopantetheine-binding protein, partial [Streptomyces vietnamensis]|uniref:acyl carrier protein n=1 Tax=Streptomyces vietnamensis TaxID=362257 RepID=UPI0034302A5D
MNSELAAPNASQPHDRLRLLCAQVVPDWDDEATGPDTPLYFESIAAAELKALIESEFDAVVPLIDLIEEPTLDGIAALIEEARAEGRTSDSLPVLVGDVGGRFEGFGLTDVQHAYWLGRSGL